MSGSVLLAQLAGALANGAIRIVDLTQTLSEKTPIIRLPEEFAQCAPFTREVLSRYDASGAAWYWSNFTMGEHTGTHFDAPVHWVTGRDLPDNSIDLIAPQKLMASAIVIDCSAQAAADADFFLDVPHIEAWEAQHGRIPANCWVLFRTDWSKREGDAYTNLAVDGAHTPGPTPAAMRLLVEGRDVLGMGVETIGTDAGQGHLFEPPLPAHSILHGAGRYGLQCLQNLDLLPPTGAVLITPPLKIEGGSGSPLRVLALVAD